MSSCPIRGLQLLLGIHSFTYKCIMMPIASKRQHSTDCTSGLSVQTLPNTALRSHHSHLNFLCHKLASFNSASNDHNSFYHKRIQVTNASHTCLVLVERYQAELLKNYQTGPLSQLSSHWSLVVTTHHLSTPNQVQKKGRKGEVNYVWVSVPAWNRSELQQSQHSSADDMFWCKINDVRSHVLAGVKVPLQLALTLG